MARILIIDDEHAIQALLRVALTRHHHVVATVGSGEEGVALFQEQPFDLVIADIRLPGLTGPEVVRKIRAARPGVSIILMGGGGSRPPHEPEEENPIQLADRFLMKPFTVEELLNAVGAVIGPKPA